MNSGVTVESRLTSVAVNDVKSFLMTFVDFRRLIFRGKSRAKRRLFSAINDSTVTATNTRLLICSSVVYLLDISKTTQPPNFTNFVHADFGGGSVLIALRYVIHFRFCG